MTYQFRSVCPARLEADVFDPLPHEPVMYDKASYLAPINPEVIGGMPLAVCKYCGSVYAVHSTKAVEGEAW